MNMAAHAYTGPEITFAQILADPGNKSLNLNYAHQQEERGDSVSALGAVERILLNSEEDDSLRLYYISLLVNVDDLQAARHELKLLNGRQLSEADQKTYDHYRNNLGMSAQAAAHTGTEVEALVAIGVRYDDSAGEVFTSANPLLTTSTGDMSVFLQGSLSFRTPLQRTENAVLRGGIRGQTLRREVFSAVDYDTIGGNLGVSGGSQSFTWHVDAEYLKVFVDNDSYLTQFGSKLRFVAGLTETTKMTLTGSYHDQNFDDIAATIGEDGRSGGKSAFALGLRHKINENTAVGASVGYVDKAANVDTFAYNGLLISTDIFHNFQNNLYFRGTGSYQNLSYKGILGRKDNRFLTAATLGGPLANLVSGSNTYLSNVNLEGTVRYTERNSNLVGIDFDSLGGELRLIFKF